MTRLPEGIVPLCGNSLSLLEDISVNESSNVAGYMIMVVECVLSRCNPYTWYAGSLSTQRLAPFQIQLTYGAYTRQKQTLWGEWCGISLSQKFDLCSNHFAFTVNFVKMFILLGGMNNISIFAICSWSRDHLFVCQLICHEWFVCEKLLVDLFWINADVKLNIDIYNQHLNTSWTLNDTVINTWHNCFSKYMYKPKPRPCISSHTYITGTQLC